MKFDPEFKNAISLLSSKDKDKLILRLLRRDIDLANRLHFELLSTESVQERRHKMETRVKKEVTRMTDHFYSPAHLLTDAKNLNREITEHVKITRDKYGDVSLNLLMLNELLRNGSNRIAQVNTKDSHALSIYIIVRAFKILILTKSLHEDYLIEFEDGLIELGELISKNSKLMNIAIKSGFDINWLIRNEIPSDIAAIHKELRSMGLLK